uniref:RNA2 polyprotein n=1 Tax=Cowpea severe mosaic virus TaxID=12261 RepID=A0A891M2U2_9SECO|nr:polyprotein [Cowpea severe mosaic virus]
MSTFRYRCKQYDQEIQWWFSGTGHRAWKRFERKLTDLHDWYWSLAADPFPYSQKFWKAFYLIFRAWAKLGLVIQFSYLFLLLDFFVSLPSKMASQVETTVEKVRQSGIPADILKRKATDFWKKNTVHNSQMQDVLPRADEIYEGMRFNIAKYIGRSSSVSDIAKLGKCKVYRRKNIPLDNLPSAQTSCIPIKLVDEVVGNSDYTSGDESTDVQSLHVGAIEIVMNSFASSDCNILGGFLLIDTCHTEIENAIRSIFVSPMRGGRPIRMISFPDTLVQVEPNMNKRFQLLCTTSNGDFMQGRDLALMQVNVLAHAVTHTSTFTPTPYYERILSREKGFIVEYLNRMTYAVHNQNHPTEKDLLESDFNFDFEGQPVLKKISSTKAVFSKGSSFKYTISGQKSKDPLHKLKRRTKKSYIDGIQDTFSIEHATLQAGADYFKQNLDDVSSIEDTMLGAMVGQTKVVIPKTLVAGTILSSSPIVDVMQQNLFRSTIALQRTHIITGKIHVVAMLETAVNTGLGLAICFNSGIRGKASADIYTTCSQDAMIWNPSCTKVMQFSFNPNPCSDGWSLAFLEKTGFHCVITCVTGWTGTPMQDTFMTLNWHISRENCKPKIYTIFNPESEMVLNRWMGRAIFPQQSTQVVRRMPLSVGGGAGAKNAILMNLPNAILSMWRYFKADIEFELIKMSSPYINATIAFFIAFGDLPDETVNFEAFPHKLIVFSEKQDRTIITFSKEEFLMAWSTQVRPDTQLTEDGCPYLYAITHNGVSSSIEGDFVLGIKMTRLMAVENIGVNPGIIGSRLLGAVAQSGQTQQVWNKIWRIGTPAEAKEGLFQFSVDLLGINLVTDGQEGSTSVLSSSPIANLLRTSAWKCGTLHVKVIMTGRVTVSRADWASHTQMSLVNSDNAQHYEAQKWSISTPHAWEKEFSIDICGPNNGFEMWRSSWSNQTTWILEFTVAGVPQSAVFEIFYRLDETWRSAGNILMPPLLVSNVRHSIAGTAASAA